MTTHTPWREERHFPKAEYLQLLSNSMKLMCHVDDVEEEMRDEWDKGFTSML